MFLLPTSWDKCWPQCQGKAWTVQCLLLKHKVPPLQDLVKTSSLARSLKNSVSSSPDLERANARCNYPVEPRLGGSGIVRQAERDVQRVEAKCPLSIFAKHAKYAQISSVWSAFVRVIYNCYNASAANRSICRRTRTQLNDVAGWIYSKRWFGFQNALWCYFLQTGSNPFSTAYHNNAP